MTKEKKSIEIKIAELLDKEKPRPHILECLRIFQNLEDSFIEELEQNMSKDIVPIERVRKVNIKWWNDEEPSQKADTTKRGKK